MPNHDVPKKLHKLHWTSKMSHLKARVILWEDMSANEPQARAMDVTKVPKKSGSSIPTQMIEPKKPTDDDIVSCSLSVLKLPATHLWWNAAYVHIETRKSLTVAKL